MLKELDASLECLIEWLEVAQLQYLVFAAVVGALHLAVMVRAVAVWLSSLNKTQCYVCVQHTTLNV